MKTFCQIFVFLSILFYQSSSVFSMDGESPWGEERNKKDEAAEDDLDWNELLDNTDFGDFLAGEGFVYQDSQMLPFGDIGLEIPEGAMDVPTSPLSFFNDPWSSGSSADFGMGNPMLMPFPFTGANQVLRLPSYQPVPSFSFERIEHDDDGHSRLVAAIRAGNPRTVQDLLRNQINVTRLDDLLEVLLKDAEMDLEARVLMTQALLNCATDKLPIEAVKAGVKVETFVGLLNIIISLYKDRSPNESRLDSLSLLITRELIELAIGKNNPELVALLMRCLREVRQEGISLNLNLNGEGGDGTTLLCRALSTGNLLVFRALLESGFIFHSMCFQGRWLYDIAEERGLPEIDVYLRARSVEQVIALAHARIHNAIDKNDVTLLLRVLTYCDSFRGRGGYFSLPIGNGDYLIQVLKMGNVEVLKRFVGLVEDFDINRRYSDGMTLLHFAYKYRLYDAVSYLIDAGADLMIVDDYGVAPIDYSLVSL